MATHAGTPTQRRAVVRGAVRGAKTGPAGAARGAGKSYVGARRSGNVKTGPTTYTGAHRATSSRPSRTRQAAGYGQRRSRKFAMSKLEGPQSGALFAEYFGGALIISLELFTQGASRGYLNSISRVMVRLTALTAVFFVLFLMQGSKRGGQFAVWFGLLVDLGVIFTAARGQTLQTTADIVSGKGIQGVKLLSSGAVADGSGEGLTPPPVPAGVQLPDE